MTCARCRRACSAEARFCSWCGARLHVDGLVQGASSRRVDLTSAMAGIARTAARLGGATSALIWSVESDDLRLVAENGVVGPHAAGEKCPITPGTPYGQAAIDGRPVHVRDLALSVRTRYQDAAAFQHGSGARTGSPFPCSTRASQWA